MVELSQRHLPNRIFNRLATFIWWQLKRWTKYLHENKNHMLIFRRYFLDNYFTEQRINKNGIEINRLYQKGYVPIKYHVKVKAESNPFLVEFDEYFGTEPNGEKYLQKNVN